MKLIRTVLFVLLAAICCRSETSVFDLPQKHIRHLQLLAIMDDAHKRHDFAGMARACREGVDLGSSDELWLYNLACALALQGKTDDALAALDRAIERGFIDPNFLSEDPDLASLQGLDAFKQRVARIKAAKGEHKARPDALTPLPPDASGTAMQTASNTLWSFQLGLFNTYFAPATNRPTAKYQGPEADAINAWEHEGTASGTEGLLYANRDGDTQPLDIARFPGLWRLGYSQEMVDRKLTIGQPNTLFAIESSRTLLPVIGHSSMGYLNSPYWRSQPRALCGDPRQMALQSVFLLGNQLFFYPAYGDFTSAGGDLFPANTPYSFAVAGGNNAERPFLEAAFAALAAFRPETRAALTRSGLLTATLQMLFRASQRTVPNRSDYLTGLAHPAAFSAANLDTGRLVRMAHALTTNDLPQLVVLSVLRETQMVPDRDFFDNLPTEQLFDTPLAVARVFRGAPQTRTLDILAQCRRSDARLHWVVLQGDPTRVVFTPCPTNSSRMRITVAYQEPFQTPVGNGISIRTARVDIGVIAETAAGFSAPSFVSFYFLSNERRTYAKDGRILSIDYTRPQSGYVDPLMTYTRNWKDRYLYDSQNRLTGWIRTRGLQEEHFTAFGHLVVATDALGRAARAHVVRYLPRHTDNETAPLALPDLAQTDDNIEVAYHYQSDSDLVGTPDLSTIHQLTAPPENAEP